MERIPLIGSWRGQRRCNNVLVHFNGSDFVTVEHRVGFRKHVRVTNAKGDVLRSTSLACEERDFTSEVSVDTTDDNRTETQYERKFVVTRYNVARYHYRPRDSALELDGPDYPEDEVPITFKDDELVMKVPTGDLRLTRSQPLLHERLIGKWSTPEFFGAVNPVFEFCPESKVIIIAKGQRRPEVDKYSIDVDSTPMRLQLCRRLYALVEPEALGVLKLRAREGVWPTDMQDAEGISATLRRIRPSPFRVPSGKRHAAGASDGEPQPIFYPHPHFEGPAVRLAEGMWDTPDMTSAGLKNDDVSSFKVPMGYEVTIFQGAGFTGQSQKYVGPEDVDFVGFKFNDQISSLQVVRTAGPATSPRDLTSPQSPRKMKELFHLPVFEDIRHLRGEEKLNALSAGFEDTEGTFSKALGSLFEASVNPGSTFMTATQFKQTAPKVFEALGEGETGPNGEQLQDIVSTVFPNFDEEGVRVVDGKCDKVNFKALCGVIFFEITSRKMAKRIHEVKPETRMRKLLWSGAADAEERAVALLKENPTIAENENAVWETFQYGKLLVVKQLLASGVDLNKPHSKWGVTPNEFLDISHFMDEDDTYLDGRVAIREWIYSSHPPPAPKPREAFNQLLLHYEGRQEIDLYINVDPPHMEFSLRDAETTTCTMRLTDENINAFQQYYMYYKRFFTPLYPNEQYWVQADGKDKVYLDRKLQRDFAIALCGLALEAKEQH